MMRNLVSSALLMAVCIFVSCDGGDSGNDESSDGNNAISALSFLSAQNPALSADVSGTVSGTTIAVTVPYGTAVIALVADFTTTGVSVTVNDVAQESSVSANDFTDSVTYTVTGADGSTRDYTVTVTVAAASAKEITAFSFPAVTWSVQLYNLNFSNGNYLGTAISGTSITAKLPYGSTSLVAAFATTGASVTVGGVPQMSGVTENDFTNPVTYRVTAADGSTQDYTVTVLFVPAVNSAQNIQEGGVLSSYWKVYTNCPTTADSMPLRLTCDAVNAGSDNFTMEILMIGYGVSGGYFLPFNLTATGATITQNDYYIKIVAPLNVIQDLIERIELVPPPTLGEEDIKLTLMDKNGLQSLAMICITINEPDPVP